MKISRQLMEKIENPKVFATITNMVMLMNVHSISREKVPMMPLKAKKDLEEYFMEKLSCQLTSDMM